ncbi:hypothetical protein ACFQU7_11635 [Pseudoroseomonas wenyumeiae]
MKEPLRCRPPATGTVQIDNEDMRVMRWDFPPGSETGWHRHGFAYAVVPLHAGTMLIELPEGRTMDVTLTPAFPMSVRPAPSTTWSMPAASPSASLRSS